MKTHWRILPVLILILFVVSAFDKPGGETALTGAWKVEQDGHTLVAIYSDGYFSVAKYQGDEFINTYGGSYDVDGDGLKLSIEFNASDSAAVGQAKTKQFQIEDSQVTIGEKTWTRIDDGEPGALQGAWLITGRQRDGEISRRTPGVRKTMKILSGTRFQWIAYNTETGQFFGTGGGTYTTGNGKYTENIKFFSRDASRVGASLEFDYELVDGEWHHKGKSSRGDSMYEIWTRREAVETAMMDGE